MGIEATRRDQLVRATIAEIGEAGSASVTVSQIARRAGVSSALAFHYFGDKEQLFLSAMREILRTYKAEVLAHLGQAASPRDRLEAIVRASFAPSNFVPNAISAWLVFYATAQQSPEAERLLRLYRRRLRSALLFDLKKLNVANPQQAAEGVGALIDGLYIRQGQTSGNAQTAIDLVQSYLSQVIDPN